MALLWFIVATSVASILSTVSSSTTVPENIMEFLQKDSSFGTNSLHYGVGTPMSGNLQNSSGTNPPHFFAEHRKLKTDSCPISFNRLSKLRASITQTCSKAPPERSNNTWPQLRRDPCCNIVLTSFAIAAAEWTDRSDYFRVNNEATLRSCVSDIVSEIKHFGTGLDVSVCFSESFFRYSNRNLALCGPKTLEEYEEVVGRSTLSSLKSVCKGNLSDSQVCNVCSVRAQTVFGKVSSAAINNGLTLEVPDANVPDLDSAKIYDCIYLTVTYIASQLNPAGPFDAGVRNCLYRVESPCS